MVLEGGAQHTKNMVDPGYKNCKYGTAYEGLYNAVWSVMKMIIDVKIRRKRPKNIRLDGIENNIRITSKFKKESKDWFKKNIRKRMANFKLQEKKTRVSIQTQYTIKIRTIYNIKFLVATNINISYKYDFQSNYVIT